MEPVTLNDFFGAPTAIINTEFGAFSIAFDSKGSENINISGWLPWSSRYGHYRDLGYGYQWWSAEAGDHRFNYASGHGGNQILVLDNLNMVIVASADRLFADFGDGAWDKERAIIDMLGKYIGSLPSP